MERLTTRWCPKGYDTFDPVDIVDNEYSKTNYEKIIEKLGEYEDTEEQGLLVRVECRCKDCVHWSDMVAGATEHVKLCTIGGYMVGKNGYCLYGEKKLKGEEHE